MLAIPAAEWNVKMLITLGGEMPLDVGLLAPRRDRWAVDPGFCRMPTSHAPHHLRPHLYSFEKREKDGPTHTHSERSVRAKMASRPVSRPDSIQSTGEMLRHE